MSYTQFRDGYKKETTPGTSVVTDPAHDCQLFGAISEESEHPSPQAIMRYSPTGYNVKEVGAGLAWKEYYVCSGMYGLTMQNGVPIWAAMGKSSTAASVHTITPTTDGTPLPSFTLNHEQKGSATDEEYQFMGCKVDSLALVHDMSANGINELMAKMEFRGLKAQDGQALTNDPALPATANTDSYTELERKWDIGGDNLAIDGLQMIEINIANGLTPKFARTWDTGTYTGMWPYLLIEAQRKQYKVSMLMHPTTIERKMWDSLISTATAINTTFKWVRSANDYILVTATGPVVEHQLLTPKVGDTLLELVVIEPYAMSIDVKDAIAGSDYGE